jgi:hypothetical protein
MNILCVPNINIFLLGRISQEFLPHLNPVLSAQIAHIIILITEIYIGEDERQENDK